MPLLFHVDVEVCVRVPNCTPISPLRSASSELAALPPIGECVAAITVALAVSVAVAFVAVCVCVCVWARIVSLTFDALSAFHTYLARCSTFPPTPSPYLLTSTFSILSFPPRRRRRLFTSSSCPFLLIRFPSTRLRDHHL